MNRRRRFFLPITLLIVVSICAILSGPAALHFYHLRQGGRALDQALDLTGAAPESFACEAEPAGSAAVRTLLARAMIHLEKAVRFSPRSSQPYLLLGRANCLLGETERAVKSYLVYTGLRPENPLGHLELGFAYEAAGETDAAVIEWSAAGISGQDFLNKGDQARRAGDYTVAYIWNQRGAALLGIQPDIYPNITVPPALVIDSFCSKVAWLPYPENPPGTFQTEDGILSLSLPNSPDTRDLFFHFTPVKDVAIGSYDQLFIRLKGTERSFLVVEVVIDGERTRLTNYQSLPEEWSVWGFPIQGNTLSNITIGLGESQPLTETDLYQAMIDWIALR